MAGFKSERAAGFKLECMAGFVGIRIFRLVRSRGHSLKRGIAEVAFHAGGCHSTGMHPFPPAADLQFLVGEEVLQIALDPYSLQFRFAGGGEIFVQGRIEHIDDAGQTHPYNCQAPIGTAIYLHQLLQHRIATVDAEPFCLSMRFESGAVLRVFSDDGPYECGQIYSADERRGPIVF
jgi:hypothetical protein